MTSSCFVCGKALLSPYKQQFDRRTLCAECDLRNNTEDRYSKLTFKKGEADKYITENEPDTDSTTLGGWVGVKNKYLGKCLRCGCLVHPRKGELFKCGDKWLVICFHCADQADSYEWLEGPVEYKPDDDFE